MKKILTVDFDESLAMTVTSGWGGISLRPISRVMNFVFDKVRSGEWEAHIVSFRSEKDKQEMGHRGRAPELRASSSQTRQPLVTAAVGRIARLSPATIHSPRRERSFSVSRFLRKFVFVRL